MFIKSEQKYNELLERVKMLETHQEKQSNISKTNGFYPDKFISSSPSSSSNNSATVSYDNTSDSSDDESEKSDFDPETFFNSTTPLPSENYLGK